MAEEGIPPGPAGGGGPPEIGEGPCWQLLHTATDFAYRLPEAMIFVGREECDVTVQARSVDKRHAVIMFDYCDKRFKVKDLNSMNGTFVNEVRIPVQTYVQLDSMDLLRFGFDSASYQVVRVPGPGEARVEQVLLPQVAAPPPPLHATPAVPSAMDRHLHIEEHTPSHRTLSDPVGREREAQRTCRATSEEPRPDGTRGAQAHTSSLQTPDQLTAATSNSSLHSAFSEDSLLGAADPPGGATAESSVVRPAARPRLLPPLGNPALVAGASPATTPGSRVPVDAVRTLGPCGPRVPELWAPSAAAAPSGTARRTCTAPTRASNTRNSLRRAAAVVSAHCGVGVAASSATVPKQQQQQQQQPSSASCVQQPGKEQDFSPSPHTKDVPPASCTAAPAPIPDSHPTPPSTVDSRSPSGATPRPISTPTPSSEHPPTPSAPPQSTPSPPTAPSPSTPAQGAPAPPPEVPAGGNGGAPEGATPSPVSSSTEGPNSSCTATTSSSPSSASAPPPALHPMAFTVDFAGSGSKKLDIGDSLSKFVPRHRRNQSVSRQEEVKQQRESRLQAQQQVQEAEVARAKVASPPAAANRTPPSARTPPAALLPPIPAGAPCPAPLAQLRRAGYHSEGYFSSDQEEDLSTRSTDLSVRKAKAMDKSARATNLAQEKRTKPEPEGPPDKSKRLSGGADRRAISLEESASEHFARILGARQTSCEEAPQLASPCREERPPTGVESPPDNVSEAGTYTIDKESPSPEEERARDEINAVFGVAAEQEAALLSETTSSPLRCDTRTFTRPRQALQEAATNGHHEETMPKASSYRGGPNWIKEWAAQVAEQNSLAHPTEVILPPISRSSKGRVPSPCMGAVSGASPLQSPGRPVAVMGWPPPPLDPPPAPLNNRGRHKLPSLQAASPRTGSDLSDPLDSPVRRRNMERSVPPADTNLETESYLRTTESVMTAMQARIHAPDNPEFSEEEEEEEEAAASGPGNNAVHALGSQLRAKLRALEQKAGKAAAPSPPAVRRLAQREEGRQSDSSSEAGDHKPRHRERADSASAGTGPTTSLRRARLDAEEAERARVAKAAASRVTPPRSSAPPAGPRTRKPEPQRPSAASKPPTAPGGNFSRADGGRFSLRAGKVGTQAPAAIPKTRAVGGRKEPVKKGGSAGRGHAAAVAASQQSREAELQNWKRRKSYDPMKAAAEGKRKAEAARRGVANSVQNNIMTQSAIVMTSHISPNTSPLNSILRSASFHGTGGMSRPGGPPRGPSSQGSACTSEDEATLSAEEDLLEHSHSPISPRRLPPQHGGAPRARPSPLPPHAPATPPSPLRAVSQPPDHTATHARKTSLDETMDGGSRGFIRNTTPTSSVRSRGKLEALDNLVIAAIHGFSNKIKGSSHNVLSKLRVLFQEDPEKAGMLEETLALLEEGEPATSSPSKSPSKELSGTLRNLKKLEHVFSVLDEVLFGDDEVDVEEDLELSDLEADQLAD